MNIKNKKLIVVLGMHRSGTSAVTKSLELLGIDLGNELHPANFDNPKGFWEDQNCLEINERLLKHLGSAYDRLDKSLTNIENDSEVLNLKHIAINLLKSKLESNDTWAFKDPRTCRLLTFWNSIFDELDCQINYVIVIRNPLSVAESLLKRNETPPQKTYYLWLQHVLPSITFTEKANRVFIDYDDFIDNPHLEITKIARKLGTSMPNENSKVFKCFLNDFLTPSLRHSKFKIQELLNDNNASKLVIDTYQLLIKLNENQFLENSENIQHEISNLNKRLAEIDPAIDYINSLESSRMSLWKEINQLESERTQLNQQSADKDAHITQLNQQSADKDAHINQLNQQSADKDAHITQLNQQSADKDAHINQLNQEVSNKETQLNNLNIELNIRDKQIERQNAEIQHILNSTSWKISAPLRFASTYLFKKPLFQIRKLTSDFTRNLWHNLPVPINLKLNFKHQLFSRFPLVFKWSQAYKSWNGLNNNTDAQEYELTHLIESIKIENEYAPPIYNIPPKQLSVRLIAFYLPQFHTIPENNLWWGEGFTEWSNVIPAKPQFKHHYQPHIPGDLGYYNLLDVNVQKKQVELAKLHGVGGFCFYTYWFGGKLLLEKPVQNFLNEKSISFPFCLCWANENWSRRWDGLDNDILIEQHHSNEDDIGFIQYVSTFMQDKRYIRINGKPLLLVYRPSLLPSAKDTSKRWREWCLDNGIGEIYLAYTQSFETADPAFYGFDAAIEFPPNNSSPPIITESVEPFDNSYSGIVYDWQVFLKRSRNYTKSTYKLYRSVCPSWDNTARKKNKGAVFLNSNPKDYQEWLLNAINETCRDAKIEDEKIVFVNAWNEWAEGAHLEPDQKYGYAYLNATREALTNDRSQLNKLLLVTHDAHPHGAQYLVLNLAKSLTLEFNFSLAIVCLGEGELIHQYSQFAEIHQLDGKVYNEKSADLLAQKLATEGYQHAIVNTTVSGKFTKALKNNNINCISLIHEQSGVIEQYNLHTHVKTIADHVEKVIFPTKHVAEDFQKIGALSSNQLTIRPQGVYKRNFMDKDEAYINLRHLLSLPKDSKIVLGVGYADYRKGIDLFVKAGLHLLSKRDNVFMLWIGHWEESMQETINQMLSENPKFKPHFIFPGKKSNTDIYYAGADVFALSSREDPFPSVVLEAMDAGLPVVAFENIGGCDQLFSTGGGKQAKAFDIEEYVNAISKILSDTELAKEMGLAGKRIIEKDYNFKSYIFDLLKLLNHPFPRVSVVIPNYNYAKYLTKRIASVEEQLIPIFEIIILDDASKDNSIEIINSIVRHSKTTIKLNFNEINSGSVFAQWQKGVELASGDFVWIAEADDLAENNFLSSVLPAFKNTNIVLSYCESKQIDINGNVISNSYLDYLSDIDSDKWLKSYINNGESEIRNVLSVKNTIPNVSAVVFRRNALQDVFVQSSKEIKFYKKAGDWLTYYYLLTKGDIAFSAFVANSHRRHNNSVIADADNKGLIDEISQIQSFIAQNHTIDDATADKAKKYILFLKHYFKK